ncbi:MAG: BREX system P-loop protein BrxC [Vulcanimicrobiota bacterium]
MQIDELFDREIYRSITGVVKVEQTKAEEVFQELIEFVITKELRKHFHDFFKAYNHSLDTKTDEMGVWISGFFGSGKSHLLKMLSYLLENKDVEGIKTIECFQEKLRDDSLLFNDMKRPTSHPTDVLLFNIESKAGSQDRVGKTAIVDIFMKMFNALCGYSSETPWIADIERKLAEEGIYEQFKKAYREVADEEWEEGRHKLYFSRDYFINALISARKDMSRESAELLFDNAEKNYSLSPEKFALLIKKYLESKGKNHRIVFLVDEMGQYIGDNSNLMLNLQTVTENLGIHCQGRAWVVVTSQEAIDELTKNRLKDQDFSKIQGRFTTRLNLSSSNTDEVIKKRLLLKKDEKKEKAVKETLGLYYKDECASLRNLVSFSPHTAGMKSFAGEDDFLETYPFIPYQFNLLQKVFECIRKFSHAGKHLAEGERSMLNAFHSALKEEGKKDVGVLVPFQAFYSTVESFLDSAIKRIFDHALGNQELEPFDVGVLKVLFMIKHVKEIPADIENLATLMIGKMSEDKIALRSSIDTSLTRLKAQTLICQNGDLYDFLTDEEQDVEKGIRAVKIDFDDVLNSLGKRIFEDIYPDKAFNYSRQNTYSFSRQIDRILLGKPGEDLSIHIVTPEHSELFSESSLKMESGKEGKLIIRLPDDRRYLDEIEMILKTEKYLKEKSAIKISESVERIHSYKRSEVDTRRGRVKTLLEEALRNSDFYASGGKLPSEGIHARVMIENALKTVTQNTFHKLSFIDKYIAGDSELHQILAGGEQIVFANENKAALDDMRVILTQKHQFHMKTTMKELKDRYTRKPYGWNLYDIAGVVAKLFARKEIKLEYNGEALSLDDKAVISCLTKEKEFDKVLLFKKEAIDAHLIESGKAICKTLFDCHHMPDEGDELATVIRNEHMLTEIESLKGLQEHYEYDARFPGREVIEEGIKLLKELCREKDTVSFLTRLEEKKEELEAWKKDSSPVKEFFKDTKKDIFKRALRCISQYDKHQHILEDDELINHCIQELDGIVKMPKPYSRIKDIPPLEQKFMERYAIILARKKDEEKKHVEDAWVKVLLELKKHSLEGELTEELHTHFEELLEKIRKAENIDGIGDIKAQSKTRLDKSFNRINKKLEEKSSKTIETVKINPIQVAKGKVILETQDDVKEYLDTLEKELNKVIKADKKIHLTE